MNAVIQQHKPEALLKRCKGLLEVRGFVCHIFGATGLNASKDQLQIELAPYEISDLPEAGLELKTTGSNGASFWIENERDANADESWKSTNYIIRIVTPTEGGGANDPAQLHKIYADWEQAFGAVIEQLEK